jgi:hypothetical protein
MTDHYLLMTATPHKGDPENFCLFLELLDRDVYGDISSLEEAMERREAPFYLRRVKEALVTFPDPETGDVKALFTKRDVTTPKFRSPRRNWISTTGSRATSKTSRSRPPPTTPRAAGHWLHHGHAPAPLRVQPLRRAAQPGAHARQARRSSPTRKATARSR